MNTFATLLLAFPFYLAMKGNLAKYIALAKPDASGSGTNSQASATAPTANGMAMTGNPTTAAPSATVGNSGDIANVVTNVTHIFQNVAEITALA